MKEPNWWERFRAWLAYLIFPEPNSWYVEACERADKLEDENAALKQLCAEAYQVVGALNGPVNLLDNLSAGAQGEPMPHKTVLPYSQQRSKSD